METRGSALHAILVALSLALGCGDSGQALDVVGPDAGAWAADGALPSDGEVFAGAGGAGGAAGADANLVGFGKDAGAGELDAGAAAADGGDPLPLQDGAVDGCVENDCGGCGELRCAAVWNGACVLGDPCGACPAGCFPLNVVGLADKFQCDGDDHLVCNVCACD